jgi:predicted metal-binding protein
MDKAKIEQILQSHGFTDYKWLNPGEDITLAHWVRFKCMFGCGGYGKNGGCPPAVPPVEECHKMIREYKHAVMIHFSADPQATSEKFTTVDYLALERDIFIAGYYKAFTLPHNQCKTCEVCLAGDDRVKCVDMANSRPGPDAMGIDVFATARKAGYNLQVVKCHDDVSERFTFVLID